MNFGQKEIRRIIEETALELRDPADNYVYQKNVIDAVEGKLLSNVHPATAAEIIRLVSVSETRAFFNSRKPKFSAQGSFYLPGFWLPLGGGKRVQMADATDLDLVEYGDGVEQNRTKINKAADRTREYVAERVAQFGKHPGRRLHWIECEVFGYTACESDPEDYYEEEE